MSYDPKVWTGDDVPSADASKWFQWSYEFRGRPIVRIKQGAELVSLEPIEARSILPIPSAEEIAALVECEKALRNVFDEDGNPPVPNTSRAVAMYTDAAAALARLDAVRKEQGK